MVAQFGPVFERFLTSLAECTAGVGANAASCLFNKCIRLYKSSEIWSCSNALWPPATGVARLFGERRALPNFSVVYRAVIKKSGLNKACRVLCEDLIPCQPMTTVSVSFLDH